jgi:hypothetical protein
VYTVQCTVLVVLASSSAHCGTTPSEATFSLSGFVYTKLNPFGNTLKFSVLTPLATQCFEPNPVWQKYSMQTDFIE